MIPNLKTMAYISLGAVLLAVGGWITVPFALPFTLQTLSLYILLHSFGGKECLMSLLVYIGLGAVGVPVFSGFNNLYGALAGPTAGYLLGFIAIAVAYIALQGYINKSKRAKWCIPFLTLIPCYALGIAWYMLYFQWSVSLYSAVVICVLPYIAPDALKVFFAILISDRLKKALR